MSPARATANLGFGIVGCGVIGAHHAKALAGLDGCAELVAVADVDTGRAEALAAEHGVRAHSSLQDMLADPAVQVVSVCTPSGMHADQAIAALGAGRHVLVEKPIDVSLEAANRLLDAQRGTGLKVAVVSQHRFDPAAQIVQAAASAGRFGRLTGGSAQVPWWRSQEYYDSGGWRGTWELDGGGALMNQAIHTIDLLQWVMGPAVEVTAYTGLLAHERIEVEDTAVAAVRFASGALGTVLGTTAAYPGLTTSLQIFGDRGSALIESDQLRYFHAAGEQTMSGAYGASGAQNQAEAELARYAGAAAECGEGAGADPAQLSMAHADQIADLVAAIREDRDPLVTPVDARQAAALILAIYASARSGGPVQVG